MRLSNKLNWLISSTIKLPSLAGALAVGCVGGGVGAGGMLISPACTTLVISAKAKIAVARDLFCFIVLLLKLISAKIGSNYMVAISVAIKQVFIQQELSRGVGRIYE